MSRTYFYGESPEYGTMQEVISQLRASPRGMVSSAASIWWGHLPSSQLPAPFYICPLPSWKVAHGRCMPDLPPCPGYQGIHFGKSFRWEHFSFLPFPPFPKSFPPALGHLLGIIRKVPHNRSFRCKALVNHQLRRCQPASTEGKLQSHL